MEILLGEILSGIIFVTLETVDYFSLFLKINPASVVNYEYLFLLVLKYPPNKFMQKSWVKYSLKRIIFEVSHSKSSLCAD